MPRVSTRCASMRHENATTGVKRARIARRGNQATKKRRLVVAARLGAVRARARCRVSAKGAYAACAAQQRRKAVRVLL